MIDRAALRISMGNDVAAERAQGVNDNMFLSHFHDFFEIYYLEQGERYHIAEDKIIKIKSGDLIIFPPHVLHRSFGDEGMAFKRIVIYFTKNAIDTEICERFLKAGVAAYSISGRNANLIRNLVVDLRDEDEKQEEYSQLQKKVLINSLLITIVRSKAEPEKPLARTRITDVLSYINKNYFKPMTLEELADMANITPFYLCREFKKYTNSTIVQYINTIRVLHAQRMFLETNKNMTEIAFDTGFSNITHFTRTFKQVTGASPLKTKKRLKEQAGYTVIAKKGRELLSGMED